MNAIGNEINDDLATAEQEVAAADVILMESSIVELKDFCKWIEAKIDGSYREAATKYARMDVRRTANAMTVMEGNISSYKTRLRQLLADLRKARTNSTPSTEGSIITVPVTEHSGSYKPYMERLKPPTFSGKVEDFPEFRSV